MKVLLTGVAGFIGMHTALRLLARGDSVVGVDNLNNYYSVELKNNRLSKLLPFKSFRFHRFNVEDRESMSNLFETEQPDAVVHLAAQAGVRYSLENPHAYIDSNIKAFMNVLEGCRNYPVNHLIYASSSSVYGGNAKLPFSEQDSVNHPISLYAATKKANELMAHTYSHLYRIPTTGLRFFTVYGPWGRPDMSPILFADAITEGKPIKVFNHGLMSRDFTYIDDIVEGLIRVLDKPATVEGNFDPLHPNPSISNAPYRIFNIGNHSPTPLLSYISQLEKAIGITAVKHFLPMQPGDVYSTAADTSQLKNWVGFEPNTPIDEGVTKFVEWYKEYITK